MATRNTQRAGQRCTRSPRSWFKRKATKWRCLTGECQPESARVTDDRRNPLVPRSTKRFVRSLRSDYSPC